MTTSPVRESATIYQFPVRGRFAADRDETNAKAVSRHAKAVFGTGWYHDDAIEEERAKKN